MNELPGKLISNTAKQIGAIGEYRVDGGPWRAITSPRVPYPDGGHELEVVLYKWCRYVAAVHGANGAVDVLVLPLHYKAPEGRVPPDYTKGHKAMTDMKIDAVVYITPE